MNPSPHLAGGASRRGAAPGPPPQKPSALEVFWGQITCNPVVDPTDEQVIFERQQTAQRQAEAAAAARIAMMSPEDQKRMSDLDLIEKRLREAAVKRRQERAGADEEQVLGADLVAERRRLEKEEAYKKDKADEFDAQQRAALDAKRESVRQQGVGGIFGALDVTFGLSGAISKALAPTSGFEADGNSLRDLAIAQMRAG